MIGQGSVGRTPAVGRAALAQYHFARGHDAFDIAEGAIQKAVEAARRAGLDHIRYQAADLNEVVLERHRYDVRWPPESSASRRRASALHHPLSPHPLPAVLYLPRARRDALRMSPSFVNPGEDYVSRQKSLEAA